MNNISLIGRITNDLELKTTTSDKQFCSFTIAVKRKYGEETDFIPCKAWNKTAENLVNYKKKGEQIGIDGSLNIDNYEDENGNKRKNIYVLVSNIYYLSNPKQIEEKQEAITEYKNEISENKEIENMAQNIFEDNKSNDDIDDILLTDEDLPF